jgi:hypothetical protein
MRVPGFTAESSIVRAGGRSRADGSSFTARATGVVPQAVHRHPPLKLERSTPLPPHTHTCRGLLGCVDLLTSGVCAHERSTLVCDAGGCFCGPPG